MFPLLRPLLNRGGAGYTISRAETADRLRPLVARHLELLRSYSAALPRLRRLPGGESIAGLMPYLRTDLSKLYESVYSAGGTAPTGTETDFGAADAGSDHRVLDHLLNAEKATRAAAFDEIDAVHHQERTRAILKLLVNGSEARLDRLREVATNVRRTA
ncbi:MAG TPA: hypothetical protein VK610_02280 [Rhodothermales bacterium]|nr:hypothetical protein [Rhodothermales bacterium]